MAIPYVITLLAHPDKEPLSSAFVESMAPSLALQEIVIQKTDWLKDGIACDLYIEPSPFQGEGRVGVTTCTEANPHLNPPPERGRNFLDLLDAHVQAIIADHPYDAIIQPVENRAKKLIISDMDSTMITVECIDELADFVGKKSEVASITEKAMNGELNFEAALTQRVALLHGLPVTVLQQCYDERVKLMPGAKALLAAMRIHGAHAILVSGGFTFFSSRVRDALGFHEDYSNFLEAENEMLTGRVIPPILGKEAKLATLHSACKKLGITADDVLAIGDGANDLPMLLAAGMGVAYHAKPVVRAQTKARINHCDLSALIYAQGLHLPSPS